MPQRYPVEQLAEALAEGIITRHPAMQQFAFERDDIEGLLTYIASLNEADEAPPAKH